LPVRPNTAGDFGLVDALAQQFGCLTPPLL
jgi:hypothetical protein